MTQPGMTITGVNTGANPYGTDLAISPNTQGVLDIDSSGRVVSGIQVLAQSIVMRQTTPTRSLLGAPNDCFDLRSWISAGFTQGQIQQLSAYIQTQLLRDQRIISVQVQATYSYETATLTVAEQIQSSNGPFTLTLSVSQVSVSMLVSQ